MEIDEVIELEETCPNCGNDKAYLSGYYKKLRCTKCGYGNREYEHLISMETKG